MLCKNSLFGRFLEKTNNLWKGGDGHCNGIRRRLIPRRRILQVRMNNEQIFEIIFFGRLILSIHFLLRNNVDMFLFWGGIVTIVANASKWIDIFDFVLSCRFPGGLLGGFARQLALRDGRISCAEVFTCFYIFWTLISSQGCCLGLLGCFTGMASLLEVVTLIWVGS